MSKSSYSDIKITLIGAGRVATSLGHALAAQGMAIQEVYSRQISNAQPLAKALSAKQATQSLDFTQSESNVFILAVKDDAIPSVVGEIKLPAHAIICHTSGTVSQTELATTQRPHGILYPLMTFTNDRLVDCANVPLLIEASSANAQVTLTALAKAISNNVQTASESERQLLHVAAVFASNFANRMVAAAEEILTETQLPLDILKPLVERSMQNAFDTNPDQALTGPAKRGDVATVKKHLELLKGKPELAKIYETITQSIISRFSPPN